MMPNTISEMAMMNGVPSFVSITSSNMAPTSAAGTVASKRSHPRRPSGVTRLPRENTTCAPSRTYTTTSLQK